jgi:hypothetical protein
LFQIPNINEIKGMHDYVKQTAASLLNQTSALLALADPPKNRSYCFCKSIRAIVFLPSEPQKQHRGQARKAAHPSPQTEPTWSPSDNKEARPRRATVSGKLPEAKPIWRRLSSPDTERLTQIAVPLA